MEKKGMLRQRRNILLLHQDNTPVNKATFPFNDN
jgi:hypothetical protein